MPPQLLRCRSSPGVVLYGLRHVPWPGGTVGQALHDAVDTDRWGRLEDPVSKAFAKRWFVTVAAITGSVICALLTADILGTLANALAPERVLFTLVAALVSMVLVGPVEDYIFRSGFSEDTPRARGTQGDTHRLERLLQLATPKATGRFVLVVLFLLILGALQGAFDSQAMGAASTSTMLITAIAPGVVTYYWCAALQRRLPSITRRSFVAAMIAGSILIGLPFTAADAYFSYFDPIADFAPLSDHLGEAALLSLQGVATTVIGTPIMGFLHIGAPALAGALVIDAARTRGISTNRTVALVCVATFVATALAAVVAVTGLFVSNFPALLRDSRAAVPGAAPVQTAA